MDQLWVALLAVGITLFSSGIDGSVLHEVVGGQGYIQWIPHELFYSNVHSRVDLSQLHGLRIDEALALSANEQGLVDEALTVLENGQGESRPLFDENLTVRENGQQQSPSLLGQTLTVFKNGQGQSIPLVDETLSVPENAQGQPRPLVEKDLAVPETGQRQSPPLAEKSFAVPENEQGQSPPFVDEALAIPESGQEKSASPIDKTLDGNGEELSPAPIGETSEEINGRMFITQEQLYEEIFGQNSRSSEGSNATERGISSTGVEIVLPSSINTIIQTTPTVVDLLVPQFRSEASVSQSSVSSTTIAPEQEEPLHHVAIPKNSLGAVYINTEEGKLQMQASLLSGGEERNVTIGDIPELGGESVPVIIPGLPLFDTPKAPKSHIITNVNVNLNVNGDGKGSVINSTSVAKLTAPIKTDHKKCD